MLKRNGANEEGIVMDRRERQVQTRSLSGKIPFNRLLGVEIKRFHLDGVTLSCKVRGDLLNSYGALHGGVTASLSDAAVGLAIHYVSAGGRPISTVDLKVNYFLPVREGVLLARARLLRMGSTLCVGRVDLTNAQGDAVGMATATYVFLDARGANSQK
jgi:acyl-CoA thioesterase